MASSKKGELGEQLFKEGCNCTQAVLMAYADELNMDRSTLLRLGSSFGGGMGRLREVCGAVSGIFMVAGLLYGYDDILDRTAKANHYKLIQSLAAKFTEINGSIVCRQILGLEKPEGSFIPSERTPQYYAKRPCAKCISCAIDILEDYRNGQAS